MQKDGNGTEVEEMFGGEPRYLIVYYIHIVNSSKLAQDHFIDKERVVPCAPLCVFNNIRVQGVCAT